MPLTKRKAEKIGWQFLLGDRIHQAIKTTNGAQVTQASGTEEGLLEAIDSYEDAQARVDLSEPVT
jgi:hypothetical protein